MASSIALKLTCVVLMCMVAGAPLAQAITCGQVATNVAPCVSYLRSGGTVPTACCNGVKSLNSAASDTATRQAVCRCLVSAATNMGSLNPTLVSGLPSACGVSLPFKISTSTNCNNIK
ncbi:non-specific lipid-transfer protein 1-like [Humulus lupulus]|uniref:non-specific lipid-transfer protein 1-like n=1 Tax=Humulus lupulus TaxID=3486 RepID=UPI002B40D871|nr:non-specific lipid-transfer protein 1-like [Humulus lupulus]